MHILIAGMWRWPQYEAAFARGLRESGAQVSELSLTPFFQGAAGRVQGAFPLGGPLAWRIGRAVIEAVEREKPDFVLFWRPTHLLPETLRTLRAMGVSTISYNNDDPFSPRLANEANWRARNLWRLYNKALPEFDFNYFYRPVNVGEARARGARHADVLLPYFLPWNDRPVTLAPDEAARFSADLVFAGHFEPDGRDGDLVALTEAGMTVRVWGDDTWQQSALAGSNAVPQPIVRAMGEDYARALAGAQICLCYLSKLNRDGYTRRCFEIPAAGRVMLAERTDQLLAMFREDEEACFFSSREELIEKARWLMGDAALRTRIAEAGRARVWADGRDVASTARRFLEGLTAPNPMLSERG